MASVFLSYDRDDTARARPLAAALEKAGHSVWWDLHVRGGAQFSKVIEEALKAADAVVVLWSVNSIDSAWVRDEAAAGRDSGRLVPVTIDGTQAPLGFRQFQTIDLSRWRGRGSPPEIRALFADVEALSGAPTLAPTPAKPKAKTGAFRIARPLPLFVGAAVILLAAAAWWLILGKDPGVPTVVVSAADPSPSSHQVARDLLVNLGNLQSAKSGSMTLVNGADGSSNPDLILQAASTGDASHPAASITLFSGDDHGVLWSNDFDQPSGNASDLKQQLAFTAARVLACALEGLSENSRLRAPTLKTYLNACAQLSEIATADPRPVIPMLQQVTRDAPGFVPAWRKLLVAEAFIADPSFTNEPVDESTRSELRRLINAARKQIPDVAEANLAETVLLPPAAYGQRLSLIERAVQKGKDDPYVLSFRSSAYLTVGRMREAVEDAKRATEIDPLSPDLSCQYMVALSYSGLLDSARDQLGKIERLWPGSTTASNCRYFYYFRYGDPKVALDMPQSKDGTAGVKYLIEARADPSPANIQRLADFLNARRDKLGIQAGPARLSYYILGMATFHRHDEAFDTLMRWANPTELAMLQGDYFRPEMHEFRREPRFLQVMKRAGLLDYWRTSGKWPDFCFDADVPYDCKKEAAKLYA